MKKDSYEIGDWILAKDGRTVQITHHDQDDLHYKDILRSLESHEVPEFTHHASIHDYGFTKEDFWDIAMKHCPLAMGMLCKWIDEYKEQVGWQKLFNGAVPKYVEGSAFKSAEPAPKFHDLPYDMQYGILFRFFQQQHMIVFMHYMEMQFTRGAQITQICYCLTQLEVRERNKDISSAVNLSPGYVADSAGNDHYVPDYKSIAMNLYDAVNGLLDYVGRETSTGEAAFPAVLEYRKAFYPND